MQGLTAFLIRQSIMITPEKLYACTDNGLLIIGMHYPDALDSARTGKPFRARISERTPSARVRLFNTSKGQVWKMTDFGGDGRAIDPIQIHMEVKGLNFSEALMDLASIFNVSEEISRTINRPDIRKEPATPEQPEGDCTWDIDQDFTPKECAIMGPKVTVDHLKSLNWYRVKRLTTIKNREATHKYPNENYPIFMRECWFTGSDGKPDRFYKIYEPLNADKQWRFQYQPKGKKPQSYINGLHELIATHRKYNESERRAFELDPENEDKHFKEKKLPEAIICSGERDALCVRSLGYSPIWFNSETYNITEDEFRQITRYAETVYNIPDIDATGKKKGKELALRYIDIHTIWLPEKLADYRDHRGNPRKDFRDWNELYKDPRDFRKLLELATPAKFWSFKYNSKTGETRYSISISCLHEFLRLNGFFSLRDERSAVVKFIKITGSVVKEVTPKMIREFVVDWAIDSGLPRGLRDLILTTPTLSAVTLEALKTIELDFSNSTANSQHFYFKNFSAEVTAHDIQCHDYKFDSSTRHVWDNRVIQHNPRILPAMFEITNDGDPLQSEDYNIRINDTSSKYFCYLINSSRLYWRQELEFGLEKFDPAEAEEYRKSHKFDIEGPNLTDSQIQEQKQCLISKIFTIGYMMHSFKSPSRAWAAFAMDNIIGENDQCNGRSGKSFMFVTLSKMLNYVKLSGRNPRLMENPFVFEQITRHTDMVLVDDCAEYLPIKEFYDSISMDMTINAKNVASYTLPFEESPKFAFTTNYVPKEFNQSSRQRMLYVVFGDYYHQRTEENDYRETRQIRDDFKKDLFSSSYTEDEWEADLNFIMQCVQFYLSVSHTNVKIEPQLSSIVFRKYLRDMSDNFKEWAEGYFSEQSGNLDREIIREEAFEDYKRFSNVKQITMQKFSKSLRGFCYTSEYIDELNPEELHNSGNRIIRRRENPFTKKTESKEMIYLRSKKEAERLKNPPPVQQELPF